MKNFTMTKFLESIGEKYAETVSERHTCVPELEGDLRWIYVEEKRNKATLFINTGECSEYTNGYIFRKINIKFCPYCGTKLESGE